MEIIFLNLLREIFLILMEQPKWDKDLLEELSKAMEDASICGLGQAAPNPIRSVVNYFPKELD